LSTISPYISATGDPLAQLDDQPVRLVESTEAIACPLCHARDRHPWGAENGFEAVKCLQCGLVYVTPRPKLGEISEANKIGEHRTAEGSLNVVYRRSARKIRHYRHIVKLMFGPELDAGVPLSWLDVGAGYGEMIEAVAGVLPQGSRIEGIEPMQPKVDRARALNLPVSNTPLAAMERRFDVVSLINVFSHLPDFDAFLADLRRVMNDGAVLFIETGNGGDLTTSADYPDRLYLPDHLVFAGVDHVSQFLQRNGFDVSGVHSLRLDTLGWMAKNIAKRVMGRDAKLSVPLSSPFRTVFFKARLQPRKN
jgi:2-polyprenyl-3-methyl-5-hydroxy-6-metoxy-1,4-benzoquinol methylase